MLIVIVLDHQHSHGSRFRAQRDAEPGRGRRAALFDIATCDHLFGERFGQQQRFAGTKYVVRKTLLADRTGRRRRVVFVQPEFEMKQIRRRIVKRDETIFSIENFADRTMDQF